MVYRAKLRRVLEQVKDGDLKVSEAVDLLLGSPISMWEMANMPPQATGLPLWVWICENRKGKHNRPRLKAQDHKSKARHPVSIDEPITILTDRPHHFTVTDLKRLKTFIRLNRKVLLAYWNQEIATPELVRSIKPIGRK